MENKKYNIYFPVIDDRTRPILLKLRDERASCIKLWFNASEEDQVVVKMRDKDIIQYPEINNELTCYLWDITSGTAIGQYSGFEHLVSRCVSFDTEFICVVNKEYCNDQLVLFQDARHRDDYPQKFILVKCFSTYDALIAHLRKQGAFRFNLEDANKFKRCQNFLVQGAKVYQELSTGRYWYLDNLHKNHYEVFSSTKRHLGEADLDGNLDVSKADSSKHLN